MYKSCELGLGLVEIWLVMIDIYGLCCVFGLMLRVNVWFGIVEWLSIFWYDRYGFLEWFRV